MLKDSRLYLCVHGAGYEVDWNLLMLFKLVVKHFLVLSHAWTIIHGFFFINGVVWSPLFDYSLLSRCKHVTSFLYLSISHIYLDIFLIYFKNPRVQRRGLPHVPERPRGLRAKGLVVWQPSGMLWLLGWDGLSRKRKWVLLP